MDTVGLGKTTCDIYLPYGILFDNDNEILIIFTLIMIMSTMMIFIMLISMIILAFWRLLCSFFLLQFKSSYFGSIGLRRRRRRRSRKYCLRLVYQDPVRLVVLGDHMCAPCCTRAKRNLTCTYVILFTKSLPTHFS